jgi:hypothetical protein
MNKYRQYLRGKSYFITIDPGARKNGGTGVAQFETKEPFIALKLKTKLLKSNLKEHTNKCNMIIANFRNLMHEWGVHKSTPVFIERPRYFDSFVGIAAAKSDSLFKLIYLYGRLEQVCLDLELNPIPMEIVDWKGQLDKKKVSNRVERMCGKKFEGDVTDAVGIGLYIKGLM